MRKGLSGFDSPFDNVGLYLIRFHYDRIQI